MGSFLVRWENCVLWLGVPLWFVVFLFSRLSASAADALCSAFPHHGSRHLSAPLRTCHPSPLHQRVPDLPPSLQLPTLYFAVLMLAHVLDHFIFSSKLLTTKVKNIFFGVFAFLLLFSFWWFKGVLMGVLRNTRDCSGEVYVFLLFVGSGGTDCLGVSSSRGISITIDRRYK